MSLPDGHWIFKLQQ